MQVRFWGTRGSVPTPGVGTVRYGGNTSCVEIRGSDDRLIVLDAGTGIRALGRALAAEAEDGAARRVDLFVTHAHWDHIQGLPFFAPLYEAGATVAIWGPLSLTTPLEDVLAAMLAPAVFPVGFAQLAARLSFPRMDTAPVSAGATRVAAFPALHPGGAAGFRVEPEGGTSGRAIVYFPDNEVRATSDAHAPDDWRRRFCEFAAGARVLIHDAMYVEAEYAQRRGWGHSTVDDAVALAVDAGVPELVLFHHDPDRTDDALDGLLAGARTLADGRVAVRAAAEGDTFSV